MDFAVLPPLCLLLVACEVGRNYRAPPISTPATYAQAATMAPVAIDPAAQEIGSWWRSFNDPELDSLIGRALAANLDMQTAASRIRQARYHERELRAQLFPTVDANASATRTKLSSNSISLGGLALGGSNPSSGSGTGGGSSGSLAQLGLPGTEFNTFQLGFDMSWELDLFGKTRRAAEAAAADRQALGWSLRDTWVSLAAEIAQDYFELRSAQLRCGIREQQIAHEQRKLDVIHAQVASNLATTLSVQQQESELALSQSQLPPLQSEIQIRAHALSVLLGQTPESLLTELATEGSALAEPPAVPIGLPSELLQRRPDVRVAERRLAQASAKTGEATADLYPRITLTASPALISTALSNLVSSGSENASIGGTLAWNVFDGGKLRAALHEADESEKQSLLAYQKSVLIALQDVEDALSQLVAQSAQTERLQRSLSAAKKAEAIADAQYRAGIAPFTTLLSAQATQLDATDRLIVARADRGRDTVALYKALGGGWQTGVDKELP